MGGVPTLDLDRILQATGPVWSHYREARILLTGGTGFFGAWLLESLLHARERHGLRTTVTVLTRDPEAFRRGRPHLATHPAVTTLRGDVLSLEPPPATFTHVIHAAAPVDPRLTRESPGLVLETLVEGTRRVLAAARACGARRLLFTSSGAVYGPQPPGVDRMAEEPQGLPVPGGVRSAYGEGKRMAEILCADAARGGALEPVIARCFAFAGPYLPLDGRYAIGNFVRDAREGRPIHVAGDGTPVRSYLYGGDLAAWLWTLLARGEPGRPYNVGSEKAISIGELAGTVARVLGSPHPVEIAERPDPGAIPQRYVPSTRRAREELGLAETFDLETSIRRMGANPG